MTDLKPSARWLALLLSLLTPGLGELYAGRPRSALTTFLVLQLPLLALVLWMILPSAGAAGVWAVLALGLVLGIWNLARAWRAAGRDRRPERAPYDRWWVYAIIILAVLLVWQPLAVGTMRRTAIQAFRMPSNSMEPMILSGDYFFVDRRQAARFGISRDDIVAFASRTQEGVSSLKRVAGVPGDRMEMRHGVLDRNGAPVAEPFVQRVDSLHDIEDPEMRVSQLPYVAPRGFARIGKRLDRRGT